MPRGDLAEPSGITLQGFPQQMMVIYGNPQSIGSIGFLESSTKGGALSKHQTASWMRCTDALWSGSGFRTQRCLRDPAEDGDHLGTMTEVWMELGLIPGEQLLPDRKPLGPISESKHQGCCNLHSIPRLNSDRPSDVAKEEEQGLDTGGKSTASAL